ncbi:hypothetical protein E1A91_D07G220300v1 [Gossypium mustelinum]|uniref:Uncharacterized protein n=1 Tax=Gossypium mustelinum TaxID=34275 RepID=A0A5D2UCZ7_GOSMU|nr:hypothetical protein E1A91_D07G220300v1 [Gossypium mustelinum]
MMRKMKKMMMRFMAVVVVKVVKVGNDTRLRAMTLSFLILKHRLIATRKRKRMKGKTAS